MTTLNPSHDPFKQDARHGQAVHDPTSSKSSSFPDQFPHDSDSDSDLGVDSHARANRRAKGQGRRRIQRGMVPVPDLRFEQSYLVSIRPFIKPRPTRQAEKERGQVEEKPESTSLVTSTESDEVFHWGRQVDVDWAMVSWITVRDHFVSPLVQGALWGVLGIFLSSSSASLRAALYPSSHTSKGRIVGGSGGSIAKSGGGGAVGKTGEGGWWRRFVGSWAGAVETATA